MACNLSINILHISCHVHLVAYMVCMSQVTLPLLWAANPSSRATHHMGYRALYYSLTYMYGDK